MSVIIEKPNGETINWSAEGVLARDFIVASPDIRSTTETIDGRPGTIDYGADYGVKTITIPFMFKAYDKLDWPLKRDEVLALLGGIEPFYIYEGVSTGKLYDFEKPGERSGKTDEAGNPRNFDVFRDVPYDYVYGKRYYVRRTSPVEPEQDGVIGKGTVEYELVGLPFGESAATTQTPFEIGDTGDPMKDNVWTLGHAEIFQDLQYTFDNPGNISVYNGGTEKVDPCYMKADITFSGASDGLTIRNNTNGTEWKHKQSSSAGDEIDITGIESYKNGVPIVRETTLTVLELEPGWNDITVSGAGSGSSIAFDFRFYYR